MSLAVGVGGDAVGVGSLGNYTKLPTTTLGKRAEKKAKRYQLLTIAADLLPGERVAECSRFPVPGEGVDLVHDPNTKTGHFHNLAVCGSVWTCPVCAARLSFEKREELAALLAEVDQARGVSVMLTFTLSHHLGDRLQALMDDLNAAFKGMKSGRSWSLFKKRYGLIGDVVGNEIKWGKANGWHPHKHVVLVFDQALNQDDLDEIQAWVSARYRSMLAKESRFADKKHGVLMTVGDIDDYMTKWGLEDELTGLEEKAGDSRNPFELLEWAGGGDDRGRALFLEYVRATKGMSRIKFSRGLRKRYGLDGRDLEQERLEVHEEGVEAGAILENEVVETLDWWEWQVVVQHKAQGDLLRCVATGHKSRVWDFLELLGVPRRESKVSVERWLERFKLFVWSVSVERQGEMVEDLRGMRPLVEQHGLTQLYEQAWHEVAGLAA